MRGDIIISVLTLRHVTGSESGARILEILREKQPAYLPERFGVVEPLRTRWDGRSFEPLLDAWTNDEVHWKRRAPTLEGSAWGCWRPFHDTLRIEARLRKQDCKGAVDLTKAWSQLLEPDIALATVRSREELALTHGATNVLSLLNGRDLLTIGIPTLAWGTWFGKPYVDLFGAETLESAPAYRVERVREDAYFVQLTESLYDMATRLSEVHQVREAVMDHLGRDAFWDSRDRDKLCSRVPKLNVPNVR